MASIIRQDLSTKDWTIFSVNRAARPRDYKEIKSSKAMKRYEPGCPFCPGNEKETPEELLSINGGKDWSVRVVKNKFPAVEPKEAFGEGHFDNRHVEGPYFSIDGVGEHEVIIESPEHDDNLVKMDISHVEKIMRAYRERFIDISNDPENQLVIIFKNHGRRAGTSLDHPHSQLVATPFVPGYIRNRMFEAQRYYDDFGRCVHCDIIDYETKSKERVIYENDRFIAIAPYASVVPYNIVIYPKKHQSCFTEISPKDLLGLAEVLQTVLNKLYGLLNDPDYNYIIDSSPMDQSGNRYYHWHMEILPRLSTRAGFEIGSEMKLKYVDIEGPMWGRCLAG